MSLRLIANWKLNGSREFNDHWAEEFFKNFSGSNFKSIGIAPASLYIDHFRKVIRHIQQKKQEKLNERELLKLLNVTSIIELYKNKHINEHAEHQNMPWQDVMKCPSERLNFIDASHIIPQYSSGVQLTVIKQLDIPHGTSRNLRDISTFASRREQGYFTSPNQMSC